MLLPDVVLSYNFPLMKPYLRKSIFVLVAFFIVLIAALLEFWFFPEVEIKGS